jgi:hypothetical protein
MYLVHKCLDGRVAEIVGRACKSSQEPYDDYCRALDEAEEILTQMFPRANRSDRFMVRFESAEWYENVISLREYYYEFESMITEGGLLGIQYDDPNKKRLFLKGLSEDLQHWVQKTPGVMKSTIPQILEALTDYIGDDKRERLFKRTVGVRTVADATGKNFENFHAFHVDRSCFYCKKPGHIQRDCPKRRVQRETVPQSDQGAMSDVKVTESNKPVRFDWSNSVSLIASTSFPKKDMTESVILRSTSAEKTVVMKGLLDSGSQKTIISREAVDKLLEEGVIVTRDLVKKRIDLMMADGRLGSALGYVKMIIEEVPIEVLVLEHVNAGLILGEDVLSRSKRLIRSLVTHLCGCDIEADDIIRSAYAVTYCKQQSAKIDFAGDTSPVSGAIIFDKDFVFPPGIDEHDEKFNESQGSKDCATAQHANIEPVALPWKSFKRPHCNLSQAMKEASKLELNLRSKRPELLGSYEKVIQTWVGNGWLKEIPHKAVRHCLRHFPVVKADASAVSTQMSKCRLVVNGSALTRYFDIPSCTHTDLLRRLLWWRFADGWCVCDISSAYMRIQIHEVDSPYLCIAWKKHAYAFTSLPMGISPSASFLQNTVDSFLQDWLNSFQDKPLHVNILPGPYMDDLICFLFRDDPSESPYPLKNKYEREVNENLANYFNRRGLNVSQEKMADSTSKTKILGIRYEYDHIFVDCVKWYNWKSDTVQLTRRMMLTMIASFYDPFGLFSEFMIRGRILFSETNGYPWDSKIDEKLAIQFWQWHDQVRDNLPLIQPRLLNYKELYVFCDASAVAIGVIVLVRDRFDNWTRLLARGEFYKKHQRGWIASSKIELLGLKRALEITRYLMDVVSEIPNAKAPSVVIGTDSEVNIQRLANVDCIAGIQDAWERRVIAECSNIACKLGVKLSHIPGGINPADHISRGRTLSEKDKRELYASAVESLKACPGKLVTPMKVRMESDKNQERVVKSIKIRNVQRACMHADERTIEERYDEERKIGQTKEQWIRMLQEQDKFVGLLKEKGTLVEVNGMYAIQGRQDLNGNELWRVVLPAVLIGNVLKGFHDRLGHLGILKTVTRVKDVYHFRNLNQTIRRYCAGCDVCQRVKGAREWTSAPRTLYSDGKVFSVVGVDIVKGLSDQIMLTCTDLYSRYVFAWSIGNEQASTIIKPLSKMFMMEGPPKVVICDNGPCFISTEFVGFLHKWGVAVKHIPRYAGFYAGFYEKSHHILVQTLILIMEESGRNWMTVLPFAVLCMNLRPFEFQVEGKSICAFEVFKGREISDLQVVAPIEDPRPTDSQIADNVITLKSEQRAISEKFEEIWKNLREKSYNTIRKRFKPGKSPLKIGDLVMRWIPDGKRSKLTNRWEGPFEVQQIVSEVQVVVEGIREHVFNLRRYVAPGIETRKRKRNEDLDILPEAKEARVASVSLKPRGMLLWI